MPHPADHFFFLGGKLSRNPSCMPPPTPPTLCSSAANNPPSSTLPAASQTPDTVFALLLQNTRPCAPSPSNSSPRSARFQPQSPRPRNSISPAPPAAFLPVPDRPPSSANPAVPAPASNSGCAHPS